MQLFWGEMMGLGARVELEGCVQICDVLEVVPIGLADELPDCGT